MPSTEQLRDTVNELELDIIAVSGHAQIVEILSEACGKSGNTKMFHALDTIANDLRALHDRMTEKHDAIHRATAPN